MAHILYDARTLRNLAGGAFNKIKDSRKEDETTHEKTFVLASTLIDAIDFALNLNKDVNISLSIEEFRRLNDPLNHHD